MWFRLSSGSSARSLVRPAAQQIEDRLGIDWFAEHADGFGIGIARQGSTGRDDGIGNGVCSMASAAVLQGPTMIAPSDSGITESVSACIPESSAMRTRSPLSLPTRAAAEVDDVIIIPRYDNQAPQSTFRLTPSSSLENNSFKFRAKLVVPPRSSNPELRAAGMACRRDLEALHGSCKLPQNSGLGIVKSYVRAQFAGRHLGENAVTQWPKPWGGS